MSKIISFLIVVVSVGLISSFTLFDDLSWKLTEGNQKKWRFTYTLFNEYDITDSIPCFKNAEITFSQDHSFLLTSNCNPEITGKYELLMNRLILAQDTFELETLEVDKLKYSKNVMASTFLDTLKIADVEQKITFLLYPIE